MTEVKKLIYSMLIENTGIHFLDSGGASNRGWQKNKTKSIEDFENEDEEFYQLDAKYKEVYRTVSVFHYLTNNLEIDEICERFNNLQNSFNNWDSDVYGVSFQAFEYLKNNFDIEVQRSWNTYNGESDLSQILQGANITINEEEYILIQIHNGADARGGYTNAKLLKKEEYCIHEYLNEWKESDEVEKDIKEGYINTFVDYWDEDITYNNKEALNILILN